MWVLGKGSGKWKSEANILTDNQYICNNKKNYIGKLYRLNTFDEEDNSCVVILDIMAEEEGGISITCLGKNKIMKLHLFYVGFSVRFTEVK